MPQRRNILFALFLCLALCPVSVLAQTTWDGGGDGVNWSDSLNWDPDGVPDSATDVVLGGGAAIQLDIAGSTHDLDLIDAVLDGPGDLAVTGQLNWGLGTVQGDGALLATGGATFLEGPDKIIGRPVELACDVVWVDSHLLFDTENGGSLHHQAGFLFSIVEHEGSRQGSGSGAVRTGRSAPGLFEWVTPSGERIQASHMDAPLVGTDPTADDTDVYLFVLDGEVLASTTVMHEVSIRIGGLYDQASGTTIFGSGSELSPGAIYRMGNDTEAIFDEGTHIVEAQLQVASGETPIGMSTTGDQTDYVLDPEGFVDADFSLRGSHTLGSDVQVAGTVNVDGETTLTGSTAALEEVNVRQISIELFEINGVLVDVNSLSWQDGQVRLSDGASLNVEEMTIDQTNTNLGMSDDGDPAESESLTVNGRFHVVRSGEVPPRLDLDVAFPNGARVEVDALAEAVYLAGGIFAGTVDLGSGSSLTLQSGNYTISPSAEVLGSGKLFVLDGATVELLTPPVISVDVVLRGVLRPSGPNSLPEMNLQIDGGKIWGLGDGTDSIFSKVEFVPESEVRRAQIENATLFFNDGSNWKSGHVDWKDGGTGEVPEGSNFIISHTATNLQMTEDGDPTEEEKLIVRGTVTVDQSASVPPYLNVPTEVASTGKLVIEPGQNLNVPNVMVVAGELRIREGGGARFTFVDSEISLGGTLSGNGKVTQALNGDLVLNGRVDPGDTSGEIGSLEFDGGVNFGPTSVTVFDLKKESDGPLQHDQIQVNDSASLDGTVQARVDCSGPVDEVIVLVNGGTFTNEWGEIEVNGVTTIDLTYTGSTVEAQVTRSENAKSIFGVVSNDVDLDGFDDEDPEQAGIQVELVADGGSGAVVATTTTTSAGYYGFEGEFDGQYLVRLVLDPDEWEPGDPESGGKVVTILSQSPGATAFFTVRRRSAVVGVTNTNEGGPGSLRVAIEDANESEEPSIDIDIGNTSGTIYYNSPLPVLRKRARIIGFGGSPLTGGEPALVLDGSSCPDCDGLVLAGGETAIQGIAIENFDGYGIVIEDSELTYVSDTRITGNGAGGILIRSGDRNHIGAGSNGLPNEITANGGPGISVLDGSGHDLQGNAIFANFGLAIDLGADGPTPNDTRDADGGPNELQNTPVLTQADPLGLNVQGSLESRPLAAYRIEVYGSEICPEGGRGDLQVLLGSGVVMTDADGPVDFVIETTPYVGELSAIATDESGATSEVSPCLMSEVTEVTDPGTAAEFFHRAFPNPTSGPTTLSFQVPTHGPIEASLHDVTGRRLVTVFEGELEAGWHEIEWDGRDSRGRALSNGIYFYTLRTGGKEVHGRVVTVR